MIETITVRIDFTEELIWQIRQLLLDAEAEHPKPEIAGIIVAPKTALELYVYFRSSRSSVFQHDARSYDSMELFGHPIWVDPAMQPSDTPRLIFSCERASEFEWRRTRE